MILKNQIKLMSGWQVEWVPLIPRKGDEFDFENAVYKVARFKTKNEAMTRANEVAKLDWFGAARLREFEYVPCRYERGYYELELGDLEDEVLASEVA